MIEPRQGLRHNSVPAGMSTQTRGSVVAPVGLPATICCEPRQTRKGAAATTDSGAGDRWAGVAIISSAIITGNYPEFTNAIGFRYQRTY
jgi:hypothetical protein